MSGSVVENLKGVQQRVQDASNDGGKVRLIDEKKIAWNNKEE